MFDVTLEIYQEGKVEYPGIISSGNMGPCISIGIYDTKNKNGYMRHQPNCDHDDGMENFIKNTLKEVPKSNAKVYICGGSYSKNDEHSILKNTRNSRKHIEYLASIYLDKKRLIIKWGKRNSFTELILNTSTGKFEVEILDEEIDDDFIED